MSAYRRSIDLTVDVIQRRAVLFRNQVVAVVAIVLGAGVAALGLGAAWPLVSVLLVVPLCGACLWLDARRVAAWRDDTFAAWVRRDIALSALCSALRANPALPPTTLDGMLGPFEAVTGVEALASDEVRNAAALAAQRLDAKNLQQHAARIGAAALLCVGVLWSAGAHAWTPLALAAPAVALPVLQRWLRRSVDRMPRHSS